MLSEGRFNLNRWFAVVAFVSIATLATGASVLMSWFVSSRMVAQEALLTREFVQSLLAIETPLQAYVADPLPAREQAMEASFRHLALMPDVLRVNIFDRARTIIWSSDRAMVGKTFGVNHELDQALRGEVVARRDDHQHGEDTKAEHATLLGRAGMFIEIYVPIPDAKNQTVIGAIEFYKRPQALTRMLTELRSYITVGAVLGGALLYLALIGLVRRADRLIRSQQRQLVDQATLAAVGEMSGAVAHGIRNPLASIRSSAELIPGADAAQVHEAASDIVAQTDRLEAWVRELLSYTQPLEPGLSSVDVAPVVQSCVDDCARDFAQRGICLEMQVAPGLPPVHGDARLLGQILRSILANAMEAVDRDGRVQVRARRSDAAAEVALEVIDSGPGLTPEQLATIGKPFFTTKPRGLGIGLAMARRVAERYGGHLGISSTYGHGTTVTLHLAQAPAVRS